MASFRLAASSDDSAPPLVAGATHEGTYAQIHGLMYVRVTRSRQVMQNEQRQARDKQILATSALAACSRMYACA